MPEFEIREKKGDSGHKYPCLTLKFKENEKNVRVHKHVATWMPTNSEIVMLISRLLDQKHLAKEQATE